MAASKNGFAHANLHFLKNKYDLDFGNNIKFCITFML